MNSSNGLSEQELAFNFAQNFAQKVKNYFFGFGFKSLKGWRHDGNA
ncbi:hypothetical protein [Paenibacillus taichungensis]|nr:hypothetical protein [Paenibacillus taichungensis]